MMQGTASTPVNSLRSDMQKSSARNQIDATRIGATTPVSDLLQAGSAQRGLAFSEALAALQLLTVSDVCGLLRISKPTLWRLRRAGTSPSRPSSPS